MIERRASERPAKSLTTYFASHEETFDLTRRATLLANAYNPNGSSGVVAS
jgi:hypothetical protein